MRAIRLRSSSHIYILEKDAQETTIMGRSLAAFQAEVFERWSTDPIEESGWDNLKQVPRGESLLFSDNLMVTPEFVTAFLEQAVLGDGDKICRAAIPTSSRLVQEFVLPLSSRKSVGGLLPVDLFYVRCTSSTSDLSEAELVLVDMTGEPLTDLALPPLVSSAEPGQRVAFSDFEIFPTTDFAPLRIDVATQIAFPIEHWVHLLTANIVFGIYGDALRFRDGNGMLFYKDHAELSPNIRNLVIMGNGCRVDPSATIIGPTILGDHVTVEPGATIVSSVLGDRCFVGQGNHVRLSVLEDQVTLAPSTNMILWSFLARGSLINSYVRYSVIGSECFIGALTCGTDRILDPSAEEGKDVAFGGRQVRVKHNGGLVPSGYWILGQAVGNRTRIASGTVIYPGRELKPDSLAHLAPDGNRSRLTLIH